MASVKDKVVYPDGAFGIELFGNVKFAWHVPLSVDLDWVIVRQQETTWEFP